MTSSASIAAGASTASGLLEMISLFSEIMRPQSAVGGLSPRPR